uniref:POTRA domain-containing protein n=1 Tax=Sporolithon durum TaxID=48970 RepID=A0A141SCV2_9FLOR|nr:hypothetical protein Sdur_062 [Sporolithon durum]AMK96120.1 hypothetical protein Sdur_062 [Sporolithon durum]
MHFNNINLINKQIVNMDNQIVYNNRAINILLQGFDNLYIRKRVIDKIRISSLINYNKELKINDINSIIIKLSLSGFFHYTNTSVKSINNKIYLIINLKLNPIVKNINVINSSKLKIPKNYLKNLLDSYVGYPKNFIYHKQILKQIEFWYLLKGYRWVKVLANYIGPNNQSLNIKILEGKICEYELKCINIIDNIKEKEINHLITKELKIIRDQTLNINNLENGITKLKKQRVILDCNYQIVQNNYGLKILIQYKLLKNHYDTYFLNKLSLYHIHSAFNSLIKNTSFKYINFSYKVYYNFNYLINNLFIDKLVNSTFYKIGLNLEKIYLYSDIVLSQFYKKLLYCTYNLNQKQNDLLIKFELNFRKYQISLSYSSSRIYLYNYCDSQASLHIFKAIQEKDNQIFQLSL